MTVQTFVIGSTLTGVTMWGIWLTITNLLDPLQAGFLGFILFFLALFLAVASTLALFGYATRRLITPGQLSAYAVRSALRQGILLSVFLSMLLSLQLMRLYQWWLAIILIILIVSIELAFLSYDRALHRNNSLAEK